MSDALSVFASGYATVEYYDTDGTLLKSDSGAPDSAVQEYVPTAPTRKFIAFYTEDGKPFDGNLGADGSVTKVYAKWYTNISDFDGSSPYNQYAFKVGSSGTAQTNHRRWGVSDGALKYSFTYNADSALGGKVGSACGNSGGTPVPVGILNDNGTVFSLSPYTSYRIEFDYKVTAIDTVNSPNGMVIRVDRANRENMLSNERRALEYGNTVSGAGSRIVDLEGTGSNDDNIVDLDLIKVTGASDTWQHFSYSFTTFDWENAYYSVDTSACNALVIQAKGYGELFIDNIRIIDEDTATYYQIYDIDGKTLLKEDFGFPEQKVALETPLQPQKTLVGFYSDIACKTQISEITLCTPEKEHKVYAKWDSEDPVTFNLNNGFENVEFTLSKYADLPDMDTFIKMCDYDTADFEGVEFAGWYSADGEQIKTVSKAQTRADNKVYAAWNYSDDFSDEYTNLSLAGNTGLTVKEDKIQPQNTYEVDIVFNSSVVNLSLEILADSVSQLKVLNNISVTDGYRVKSVFKAEEFGKVADLIIKSNKAVGIKSLKVTRLSKASGEAALNVSDIQLSLAKGTDRVVIDDRLTLALDYENNLVNAKTGADCYVVPAGLSFGGERLFVNPEIEEIQDNDINGSAASVTLADTGEDYRFKCDEDTDIALAVTLAQNGDNAAFGVVGALKAGSTNDAMRFLIRVGAQNTDTLLYNDKTFTVKERGALVSTRSNKKLTLDSEDAIKLVANSNIYNKTNCYYDYTVKVSGISDNYKNRTVVCRGYMVLADDNGNEFTVYSDNALATNYERVEEDKTGKYVDILKQFDFSSADYSIVYPQFNTSYLVVMRLEELAEQLAKKYGITVAITKDTTVSSKEILVGNTDRTAEYDISDNEYGIRIMGQKLMLLGNSPEALVSAVDKLGRLVSSDAEIYDGYSFTDSIDDIEDKKIQDYREIWTDNFDGDRINSKWETYTEFNTMEVDDQADQRFTMFRSSDKDHVFLKDGKLYQYISRPSKYYGVGVKMTTSKSLWFRYGYTEVSAKISPELGIGPGFWLVGAGDNDGDLSAEFDMLEVFGNSKYYKATPLRNRKGGSGMDIQAMDPKNVTVTGKSWQTCMGEADDRFSDEYHTFGLEWTEECYSFLLDGEIVYSVDYSKSEIIKEFLTQSPVHIVVSTTANKDWWAKDTWNGKGSMANENTDWQYGSEYSVEYVHLYQKAGQYSGKSKADVLDPKIIYGNWVGGMIIN